VGGVAPFGGSGNRVDNRNLLMELCTVGVGVARRPREGRASLALTRPLTLDSRGEERRATSAGWEIRKWELESRLGIGWMNIQWVRYRRLERPLSPNETNVANLEEDSCRAALP